METKGDCLETFLRKGKRIMKKILYSIILFIPLFIMYYILIAFFSLFPLMLIFGAQSGGWVYGMLLGWILSPILTIITIAKINKNKNLE